MNEVDLIQEDAMGLDKLKQTDILMEPEAKAYRLKFNRTLEPIKLMLVNRKQELTASEWLHFVDITRKSIIRNPDQYLGKELPAQETITLLIEKIFDEFLEHLN